MRMHDRFHLPTRFIGATMLVGSLLLSAVSAHAAPPAPAGDPNAIVANSGAVEAPERILHDPAVARDQARKAALPAQGSGEPAAGARTKVDVDKLAEPPAPSGGQPTKTVAPQTLYDTTRYPVVDTTLYPYRAMVLITMDNAGIGYRCSGFLIDPNTVATAGHCLNFNGGWSYNVRVYPGYNGSFAPYGSCNATRLFSVTGWVTNRNAEYDYGAIKLDCAIGNITGWLGFRWTSASLNNLSVRLAGYPADLGWGQWRSDGAVIASYDRLLYYINQGTGFNGAPAYDAYAYAVAIHSYAPVGAYARGTRITEAAFNNLLYWRSL